MNNTINTLVLEGLAEGGYYRDCILLFASLLLDIRFQLTPQMITLEMEGRSNRQHIDWLKVLSTAHVGLTPVEEPTTYLDTVTKNRLFLLSTHQKWNSAPLQFKQDDDIGQYIFLNKRAYGQAIACSCILQNYEFATVLYDVLVLNRIRPRKNTYFALLTVIVNHLLNFRELERVTGITSIIRCYGFYRYTTASILIPMST